MDIRVDEPNTLASQYICHQTLDKKVMCHFLNQNVWQIECPS